MIDRGRHNVLGVRIDAVDYEAAAERIIVAAKSRQPYGVSALAVHGVMTGVLERAQRFRLNALDLVVPDGQPVRWALNLLHGTKLAEPVRGPELTLETCRRAAEEGLSIFLFGGNSETLAKLRENLVAQFPKLQIAGVRPSAFRTITPEERNELVQDIRDSGAAVTMVGIGCPRQEIFAFEMREALSMPLLAVGAAFAFHAGELARAPAWLQRYGLEWFYRLAREPLRLWKRYVLLNPLYLSLVALQALRLYTIQPDSGRQPSGEVLYG